MPRARSRERADKGRVSCRPAGAQHDRGPVNRGVAIESTRGVEMRGGIAGSRTMTAVRSRRRSTADGRARAAGHAAPPRDPQPLGFVEIVCDNKIRTAPRAVVERARTLR